MISLKDSRTIKIPKQVINNIPFIVTNNRIYFKRLYPYYQILDYILDVNHKLHIGLGHFFLIQNAPYVLAAGRLCINNLGLLSYIDNQSGHYQPNEDEFIESLDQLRLLLDFRLIDTKQLKHYSVFDQTIYYLGKIDMTQKMTVIDNHTLKIFMRPYTQEEIDYVLDVNDFNPQTYIEKNTDMAILCSKKYPNDIKSQLELATQHFIHYGQYECGRLV